MHLTSMAQYSYLITIYRFTILHLFPFVMSESCFIDRQYNNMWYEKKYMHRILDQQVDVSAGFYTKPNDF